MAGLPTEFRIGITPAGRLSGTADEPMKIMVGVEYKRTAQIETCWILQNTGVDVLEDATATVPKAASPLFLHLGMTACTWVLKSCQFLGLWLFLQIHHTCLMLAIFSRILKKCKNLAREGTTKV